MGTNVLGEQRSRLYLSRSLYSYLLYSLRYLPRSFLSHQTTSSHPSRHRHTRTWVIQQASDRDRLFWCPPSTRYRLRHAQRRTRATKTWHSGIICTEQVRFGRLRERVGEKVWCFRTVFLPTFTLVPRRKRPTTTEKYVSSLLLSSQRVLEANLELSWVVSDTLGSSGEGTDRYPGSETWRGAMGLARGTSQ